MGVYHQLTPSHPTTVHLGPHILLSFQFRPQPEINPRSVVIRCGNTPPCHPTSTQRTLPPSILAHSAHGFGACQIPGHEEYGVRKPISPREFSGRAGHDFCMNRELPTGYFEMLSMPGPGKLTTKRLDCNGELSCDRMTAVYHGEIAAL